MNRLGDDLIHFGPNRDIVRGFISVGVEFIVIGGLAIAWHCPERQADDMDLLVNPTRENSRRIAQALSSLGLVGHTAEAFVKPGLQVQLKERYYAELLTPQENGPTYAEVADGAVVAKLFGFSVRLASATTLALLKSRAIAADDSQSEKHQRDLQMLEQHLRLPPKQG